MSSIRLSEIRIAGFRGIENLCLSLENTTVLTGCNNVGKTSVLRALQLALGNNAFLSQEDLFISSSGTRADKIIVDVKFIPTDDSGEPIPDFDDDWSGILKAENIGDENAKQFFAFRTQYTYSKVKLDFEKKVERIPVWSPIEGELWQNIRTIPRFKFDRSIIPFYYIEAQRDVVDDSKLRTSFLGKVLSSVSKSYQDADIVEIEEKIKELNDTAIAKSNVLTHLQEILKQIESAVESKKSEVKITPFTKKIRDLSKGLSIQYGTEENSFTMDYHGMGTRSWTSLLSFKAFILLNEIEAQKEEKNIFPIITIEEPEAHLHPDAQKRLYKQMAEIPGQKIISTHSPYVAACAKLSELRSLYKDDGNLYIGKINVNILNPEQKRRLKQSVINSKGEILFSKALILFEGETEEQALPLMAEKFFNENIAMKGIDFVSVNGAGNYFSFIHLANSFHIPWYLFSDGETNVVDNIEKNIRKAMGDASLNMRNMPNVFIISNNGDFEQMLIDDGFEDEIEQSINSISGIPTVEKYIRCNNGKEFARKETPDICQTCQQHIYKGTIRNYLTESGHKQALLDIMSNHKTICAPVVAEKIVQSSKEIPTLVKNMFVKIKQDLLS